MYWAFLDSIPCVAKDNVFLTVHVLKLHGYVNRPEKILLFFLCS